MIEKPRVILFFQVTCMTLNPEYLGVNQFTNYLVFGWLAETRLKCCNFMFLFVSRNIEKDPVCKKCSHNLKTYGQVIKRSECKNTINLRKVVSYKSENSNWAALFIFWLFDLFFECLMFTSNFLITHQPSCCEYCNIRAAFDGKKCSRQVRTNLHSQIFKCLFYYLVLHVSKVTTIQAL